MFFPLRKKMVLLRIVHWKADCGNKNGSSMASLWKPLFESFIFKSVSCGWKLKAKRRGPPLKLTSTRGRYSVGYSIAFAFLPPIIGLLIKCLWRSLCWKLTRLYKPILASPATPHGAASLAVAFRRHFPLELLISSPANPNIHRHNLNPPHVLLTHNYTTIITRLIHMDLWFLSFKACWKELPPPGAKERW